MQILAALFLGALSLFPFITTEKPPVSIKSCDVAYIEQDGIITNAIQFTNGVTVSAVNTSSKPVASFTVNGAYNGFKVTDTWSGNLLPHATISLWKHYAQLAYTGPTAECRVVKVKFADGTWWTASATE